MTIGRSRTGAPGLRPRCATAARPSRISTTTSAVMRRAMRSAFAPRSRAPPRPGPCNMRFDSVLLDIDGTILDSNDAHARAWVKAFAQHRREIPFDAIRPLIGMGGDKLLERLAGLNSEKGEGQRIAAARAAIFARDFLPSLQPTPGARRM